MGRKLGEALQVIVHQSTRRSGSVHLSSVVYVQGKAVPEEKI